MRKINLVQAMRYERPQIILWNVRYGSGEALEKSSITYYHRWVNACLDTLYERTGNMAKAKQGNYPQTNFANISLSADEKNAAKTWINENDADFFAYLNELAVEGWKTSFTFDSENDCHLAASTQMIEKDRNHRTCVTSRGENPAQAIMLNIYKIFVLHKGKSIPVQGDKSEKFG